MVPERKPGSGTILDFRLRILDSKKKTISVGLKFSSKIGKPYFEVFVQTLFNKITIKNIRSFQPEVIHCTLNDYEMQHNVPLN